MLARFSALLVVLLAPAMALAQALADRVPADAIIYVGWRGSSDLGPGYDQSNLKAVLNDSNIPQLINEFIPAVLDKIGQQNPDAQQVLPIIGAIGKPTWEHPTAFFFAGVEMAENGPPTPHLGILWQPGKDAEALTQQLQQLVGQVQPPFPVKVVHKGDLVALMVGYDNPEQELANGKGLAGDANFSKAISGGVKEPVAAIYLDYQRLLGLVQKVIDQHAPPEAKQKFEQVRDAIGLQDLKRLVVTSGFDGKDWGTIVFVEAPEPRHGIFKLASDKPLGDDILTTIPKTATMAGAGRLDLSGLVSAIRQGVRSVHPDASGQLDQFLRDLTRSSGVDLEKDLLGSLGDQWAYYTDPTIGGRGLASITCVNHLRNPQKFEQAMSKIEDFALQQVNQQLKGPEQIQLSFQTTEVDGLKIHYLAVPFVAPSWVVHNGNLYVAVFPQIAAAAARHTAGRGESILQNQGFMAVRERLGQQKLGGFSFADLPRTAPDAYGSWLVISRLAGFGDLFGIKSPPLVLPELQKLQAHLAPAGSVSWVDADGFHARAIEPFPGSTMVASDPAVSAIDAEPVLIATILPALNRAREQANRIKSAANLRQIGLGAIMYANNDKQQRFPADLGTIAETQDVPAAVFINPRSSAQVAPPNIPKKLADWVNEQDDYIWIGKGKRATAGADEILAYENPEKNTEGINILYADGHVEFVTMPEAQQQIDKAKQGGGNANLPKNGGL